MEISWNDSPGIFQDFDLALICVFSLEMLVSFLYLLLLSMFYVFDVIFGIFFFLIVIFYLFIYFYIFFIFGCFWSSFLCEDFL